MFWLVSSLVAHAKFCVSENSSILRVFVFVFASLLFKEKLLSTLESHYFRERL